MSLSTVEFSASLKHCTMIYTY